MEEQIERRDVPTLLTLSTQFHRKLHHVCGNAFLTELLDYIYTAMLVYRRTQMGERVDWHRALAEHLAIVETLRAHDADAAAELVRRHDFYSLSVADPE
jgi:DNA-binding GntR family transcriptional regulator